VEVLGVEGLDGEVVVLALGLLPYLVGTRGHGGALDEAAGLLGGGAERAFLEGGVEEDVAELVVEGGLDLAEVLLEALERDHGLGTGGSGEVEVAAGLVVVVAVAFGEHCVVVDEVVGETLLVAIHKIIIRPKLQPTRYTSL